MIGDPIQYVIAHSMGHGTSLHYGLDDNLGIFVSQVDTRGTPNTHLYPKLKVYCCYYVKCFIQGI